jgi:hypothetical protein
MTPLPFWAPARNQPADEPVQAAAAAASPDRVVQHDGIEPRLQLQLRQQRSDV